MTSGGAEYTTKVRAASWSALRAATDLRTDTALAEVLGVSQTTVTRVLGDATAPSPKFIAHTLAAFPFASFERLFKLARVDADD